MPKILHTILQCNHLVTTLIGSDSAEVNLSAYLQEYVITLGVRVHIMCTCSYYMGVPKRLSNEFEDFNSAKCWQNLVTRCSLPYSVVLPSLPILFLLHTRCIVGRKPLPNNSTIFRTMEDRK